MAEEIVQSFINAWTAMDFDALIDKLHPAIHYHNIPLEPIKGIDDVRTYLRSAWKFDACEWETLNIAANSETVLTERIDRFWFGKNIVELPVMGVFIINNEKIQVWRDYFDLTDYRAQIARAKNGG